ncbi:MAG: hypothetical protein ACLR23_16920 [Clostridia bacterium]
MKPRDETGCASTAGQKNQTIEIEIADLGNQERESGRYEGTLPSS